MKNRLMLLVTILVILSGPTLVSCSKEQIKGPGNVVEEQREVGDFDEIDVAGVGNLIVEMGDEESLRVTTDDNLLPHIKTETKGHKLVISIERGVSLDPSESIAYHVTAKELNTIAFAGAGRLDVAALTSEDFSLKVAGSMKGRFDALNSESLIVQISGSGDVEFASVHAESIIVRITGSGTTAMEGGKADRQEISITGSGKYEAANMQSDRADIGVFGSGSIVVRANDNLEVAIAGSGSVDYFGSPEVTTSIAGTGTVRRIEEEGEAEG